MPDGDTSFFMNELCKMKPYKRIILFQNEAKDYPANMMTAIHNPDIMTLLEITIIRLDVESAAELWLSLNLKHEQWDGVA
jgi:hypothetical protein